MRNVESDNHHPSSGDWREDTMSGVVDEKWDLTSPLLPQLDIKEDNHMSIPSENSVEDEDDEDYRADHDNEHSVMDRHPNEFYRTLLASLFTMTFIILVSGSYFFEWSDTVIRVEMDTLVAEKDDGGSYRFDLGQHLSIDLPLYKDATFQSTLGIFRSSQSNGIAFLIIVSSIVLPLLFMVIQPVMLIMTNRMSITRKFSKRIYQIVIILDLIMKLSITLVFVNAILNICTSRVNFMIGNDDVTQSTSNTDFLNNKDAIRAFVVNYARGGLVSYLVGLSCFGIGALALIQSHLETHDLQHNDHSSYQHEGLVRNSSSKLALALNKGNASVLSPPPRAFKQHDSNLFDCGQSPLIRNGSFHGGLLMDNNGLDDSDELFNNDDDINDRSYEENPTTQLQSTEDKNEQKVEIENSRMEDEETVRSITRPMFWEIILFESGLLSFLLLLPISTLPLVRLEYNGVLSSLLDAHTLEHTILSLLDISRLIISSNNYARDLFGFVLIALFWVNVIIVPIIISTLCTVIWFSLFVLRKQRGLWSEILNIFFGIIKLFQPFSFMTPFAISLFVTILSLQQVTDFLFNQNSTCQIIQNVLHFNMDIDVCVMMKGYLLPGAYMLFFQALCTDFFVVLLRLKSK